MNEGVIIGNALSQRLSALGIYVAWTLHRNVGAPMSYPPKRIGFGGLTQIL